MPPGAVLKGTSGALVGFQSVYRKWTIITSEPGFIPLASLSYGVNAPTMVLSVMRKPERTGAATRFWTSQL